MEWLKSIYDNALSNAERMTGGYAESDESRFGLLIAILAAVAAGIALNAFLRSRRGQRRDDDERR
jgi:hypothetical protein